MLSIRIITSFPTIVGKEVIVFSIKYNQIIKEICAEHKLQFIEINHLLNENDFADGLHPNTKGHTKLFKEIKNHLPKF